MDNTHDYDDYAVRVMSINAGRPSKQRIQAALTVISCLLLGFLLLGIMVAIQWIGATQ